MRLILSQVEPGGVRTIDPLPHVNAGFQELLEARIRVPAGGPWTFRVDDEPLEVEDGDWVWRPGFFAGEVVAELVGASGNTVATYLLDVSPDVSKLGRARFQALLDEIIDEDPSLVAGAEPATLRLGAERPLDDSLMALASLARLRLHAPGFIRAVREAGRQPRLAMRTTRAEVPLHRARRVDVRSARSLARTAAVAALNAEPSEDPAGGSDQEMLVDVPIRELDVDCAANRCVVMFIRLVRQRVRRVREWLLTVQGRDDLGETRTSLAARAAHRLAVLDRIDADLWRLLREEPWRRVTRPEITSAGLNALAADPRYARVHQLGWKALRTGIGGQSADERLWISPTWEIFERWAFVRLARLLRERLPAFTWSRESSLESSVDALAAWVGRKDATSVTLSLQHRFPSWDQAASGAFRSVSRERCPDLVLAVEEGASRRFIALDAKYRRARPNVLEAMESAHIYRDSLRWNGVRPELALLIVPAAPGAPWLASDAFQAAERVGAFVLDEAMPALVLDAIGLSVEGASPNGEGP